MFGDTLKQIRTIYGYSAKELSNIMEISPSYLSEVENNKKRPSLTLLEKYADQFNFKLSTLILLTEENDKLEQEGKSKLFIRNLMLKSLAKGAGDSDGND